MPYKKGNYPSRISSLPKHAQDIWVSAFNSAIKNNSEESANKIAWSAVTKSGYTKNSSGKWIKASESFRYFNTINLAENDLPSTIEIMRQGKWEHPIYGDFQITNNTIDNIITNFNEKVRGVDISFDLEHGKTNHKTEAVCWVKNLIKNGERLLAEVEWTKLGEEKIKNKSFKYFSPEFKFIYKDPETKKTYNNVLFGGGLTNRPYIKHMSPIILSENFNRSDFNSELYSPCDIENKKGEMQLNKRLLDFLKLSENPTEEQIVKAVDDLSVKLTESENKVKTLESEKEKLEKENKDLKEEKEATNIKLNEAMNTKSNTEKENIKLNERIKAIETQMTEAKWSNVYNVALSEGKLTPALEPVFKAQYMLDEKATEEIIKKLPVIVKLGETGSSRNNNDDNHNAFEAFDKEVNKIMLSEKMDYADASIAVAQRNPELYEKARFAKRSDN